MWNNKQLMHAQIYPEYFVCSPLQAVASAHYPFVTYMLHSHMHRDLRVVYYALNENARL